MKRTELEILEKNILAALERAGLKRANAADRLGVDRAWFYRMMSNGNWKMDILVALADLLNVPLWRLFYDAADAKELAANILVLPGGERPGLLNLNDFIEVPIFRLHVEMDLVEAGAPQESLWTLFMKKDLVGAFSAGKSPYAIDLAVKVR